MFWFGIEFRSFVCLGFLFVFYGFACFLAAKNSKSAEGFSMLTSTWIYDVIKKVTKGSLKWKVKLSTSFFHSFSLSLSLHLAYPILLIVCLCVFSLPLPLYLCFTYASTYFGTHIHAHTHIQTHTHTHIHQTSQSEINKRMHLSLPCTSINQ